MRVTIEVNGRTIAESTAVNQGPPVTPGGEMLPGHHPDDRLYELHDGDIITHNRQDGAVALAKRLLDHADVKEEPERNH